MMRFLPVLLLAGCVFPAETCPDTCLDGSAHIAWWCTNCRATVRGHACDACQAEFRLDFRRERWACAACRVDCRAQWCWSCGCGALCFVDGGHIAWWCGACGATVQGHACVTCRGEFQVRFRRDPWACARCASSCRANSCWKCGSDEGSSDDGRYAPWTCKKCGKKNATYRCPACDK